MLASRSLRASTYSRSFSSSGFSEEWMDFAMPIESRDLGHSTRIDNEDLDDALMPT